MTDLNSSFEKLSRDGLSIDIVNALRKYYVSLAFVNLLTPISEDYYQKAFELFRPVIVPFVDNDGVPHPECDDDDLGKFITHSKDLYRTSDESFKLVTDYHNQALRGDGYTAKEGLCPFLVAQSVLRESTRELVDIMEKYTGMGYSAFILTEDLSKYVTLLLGLLGCIADAHNIEINDLH
jgi:hypothetical protein